MANAIITTMVKQQSHFDEVIADYKQKNEEAQADFELSQKEFSSLMQNWEFIRWRFEVSVRAGSLSERVPHSKHRARSLEPGNLKPQHKVAPEGHVSPETEQVSSPGSASSTHLEEHDEEDYDDDDDDDDDAAAAAIDTQIQASDHEEVPIETVLPPNRPANTTYDAIVASEGKIVEAENRRHSDLMTVLERMIALQEETVSQLAHLHRVFIEVPKQLQKINTSFEALVVQQTQANYLRMTNVPQFNINTSQAGSLHAGQFSPHSSDLHSPGPNVTGQVADIAVQVPVDILPLPSVQNQQLTPTKETRKSQDLGGSNYLTQLLLLILEMKGFMRVRILIQILCFSTLLVHEHKTPNKFGWLSTTPLEWRISSSSSVNLRIWFL
ncbi:uncharacterized protein LOC142490717 [Ascaphus truei]|uniref:uncharacterized protein LOC142490717 n=1 Tax=Ascaphus truei TaxID=8439 RepID=UPI003F59E47A